MPYVWLICFSGFVFRQELRHWSHTPKVNECIESRPRHIQQSMSTATYLGSAIIDIEGLESTHPDPFHALCPLCKTQTTRLSKEILTTDNFHRLEGDHRPQALVSPSAWKQKSCLETILLGGGKVRQRLKVPGLQVTKNIPFLRLLNAPQLAEFRKAVYGSRIPSIEVDLYQDGEPRLERRGSKSCVVIPQLTQSFLTSH